MYKYESELKSAHSWSFEKAGNIFINSSKKGFPQEKVLTVTQDKGVIYREDSGINIKTIEGSLANFKLVKPGNFVISLRSFQGGIEYSYLQGIVSPAYTVLDKKIDLDDEYFKYLFKSKMFINNLKSAVIGIRDGKQISYNSFKDLLIPLPPIPEQRKIAIILSTIDKLISSTERIINRIELLNNIVMDELFKNGIKNTKLMESDIGLVPEDWELIPFENIADFKNGINFSSKQKTGEGILTVDVLNMYGKGIFINTDNLYRVNIEITNNSDYILKERDILFVRSSVKKEGVGWSSIFKQTKEPISFCGFLIRARVTSDKLLPIFITYFMRCSKSRAIIISNSGQAALTNISQDTLKKIKIPVPSIDEQKKIIDILENINYELSNEYEYLDKLILIKTSLMQVLLTGKVRVKVDP